MGRLVQTVKKWYQAEIQCLTYLQPVLLLVLRLYFGWGFFKAGLGKLQNLDNTAEYFAGLHIPLPTLNAYLAGATECFGGLFLLLGAASRVVTIPLIFTMLVAYLTQHIDELRPLWTLKADGSYNPATFFKAAPFPYLLTALIVLLFGPGAFSIDRLLQWFFDRKGNAIRANAVPDRAPSPAVAWSPDRATVGGGDRPARSSTGSDGQS
jgi:putative oxidoreductase